MLHTSQRQTGGVNASSLIPEPAFPTRVQTAQGRLSGQHWESRVVGSKVNENGWAFWANSVWRVPDSSLFEKNKNQCEGDIKGECSQDYKFIYLNLSAKEYNTDGCII